MLTIVLYTCIAVASLYCGFRALRKSEDAAVPGPYCERCGYSLHLLKSTKCPECGAPASDAKPSTTGHMRRLTVWSAALCCGLVALGLAFRDGFEALRPVVIVSDYTLDYLRETERRLWRIRFESEPSIWAVRRTSLAPTAAYRIAVVRVVYMRQRIKRETTLEIDLVRSRFVWEGRELMFRSDTLCDVLYDAETQTRAQVLAEAEAVVSLAKNVSLGGAGPTLVPPFTYASAPIRYFQGNAAGSKRDTAYGLLSLGGVVVWMLGIRRIAEPRRK